jgi:hypothetical protein
MPTSRCRNRSSPPYTERSVGVGAYLGAIDSKITDNDLLRPPGTFNYKPTLDGRDPAPVEWVVRP